MISCKTLPEIDENYTSKVLGLKNAEEYYEKSSVNGKIEKAKCPILFLTSTDDPFTNEKYFPYEEVTKSKNGILVTLPEGGHVSFITGWNREKSYHDALVIDFFNTIVNLKE